MGLSESDCDALGEECEWAEALGRCNPTCASLPEDRCGAHLSCEWDGERCQKRSNRRRNNEEEQPGQPRLVTITANPDAPKGASDWEGSLSTKGAIWGGLAPIILIVVGIGIVAFWLHRDGIYAAFAGFGAGIVRLFASLSAGVQARRDAWRAAREERAQARAEARAADEARREEEAAAARGDGAVDAGDGGESDGPVVGGLFDDTEPEADSGDAGAAGAAAAPSPEPVAPRDLSGEIANPAFTGAVDSEPVPPTSPLAPPPPPPLASVAAAPAPASDLEPKFSDQEEFDALPEDAPTSRPMSLDEQLAAIPDHLKAAAFEDSDEGEASDDAARAQRAEIREAMAAEAAARPQSRRLSRRARRARAVSPVPKSASPAEPQVPRPNPVLKLDELKADDRAWQKRRQADQAARRAAQQAEDQRAREEAAAANEAAERRRTRQEEREAARQRSVEQGMREVQAESEAAKAAREAEERERARMQEGRVRTGVRQKAVSERPSRITRWFSPRKPQTQPVTAGSIGERGAQAPEYTISHLRDTPDVAPETALGGGSRRARNPEAVRAFLQELLGGKKVGKSRNVRSARGHRGGGRRRQVQVRRR